MTPTTLCDHVDVTINVTAEDIRRYYKVDYGQLHTSRHCAVAKAAQRALNNPRAWVGVSCFGVDGLGSVDLSIDVNAKIRALDRRSAVEPFSFTVAVPASWVRR